MLAWFNAQWSRELLQSRDDIIMIVNCISWILHHRPSDLSDSYGSKKKCLVEPISKAGLGNYLTPSSKDRTVYSVSLLDAKLPAAFTPREVVYQDPSPSSVCDKINIQPVSLVFVFPHPNQIE